jgi:hypothetical protein
MHDLYYVPNLKQNLMRVGKSMDHGYNSIFNVSTCLILDNPPSRKLIAKIQMTKNRMFPLNLRSVLVKVVYLERI